MANEEYNVNFFKPLSDHARANKKLISILVAIWFVAVYGFHALLIVVSEPTPEKSYGEYQSVWSGVENNSATPAQQQTFSKTLLMVLGKNVAVKANHKVVLKDALSWSVYSILADSTKSVMNQDVNPEMVQIAKSAIGLQNEGFDKLMADLLPSSLVKVNSPELSADVKSQLPGIMELYLVHNQSFLTDTNFIGFPFHYWYTSQFLLILFVVLCWIYAIKIEKTNKKHNFIEEE